MFSKSFRLLFVVMLSSMLFSIQVVSADENKRHSSKYSKGKPFKSLQKQVNQLKKDLVNIQLTPGPQGPAGPTGIAGPQGPVGSAGADGQQGSTGQTGATGPAGSTGSQGPVGPAGENGAPGADGAVGSAGRDGLSCWDSNADGVPQLSEDINGDGIFNTLDCVASQDITSLTDEINQLKARLADSDLDNDGFSPNSGDCNDAVREISPAALDLASDGIDNNCDGIIDNGDTLDSDGDGFTPAAGDCNDNDPNISPNGLEISGDGIDNDCDGVIDNPVPVDADADGFASLLSGGRDCDDNDPNISPAVNDILDGIDNNCDGIIDNPNLVDNDADTYPSIETGGNDCDDNNFNVHPGQSAFFTVPYNNNSYDYNCDGREDRELTRFKNTDQNTLLGINISCRINATGWVGSIPPCGQTGTFVADPPDLYIAEPDCVDHYISKVQSCR